MKELEDYPWFPDALRLQQMEFIGWTTSHMGVLNGAVTPYRIWKPEGKIMDLCSGSGQPAIWMHPKSGSGYLELTDLHPSFLKTFPEGYASANVVLRTQPLDVLGTERRWMNEASGYTMYNAFHHFSAHQQKMIVSQLIQAEKPFFFVEILQPNLWSFLQILLTTTLGQFILGPFIRPFRWSRLLFTYLLPVNLLTITFDGLVSVFRSQSKEEYQRRISSLATEEYEIKIYNKQSAFGTQLTIIEGVPIQQDL